MTDAPPGLVARARSFARTLWAGPVFLLLSLVPWLVAAVAYLWSLRLHEAGHDALALGLEVAAIVVAAATGFSTLWFIFAWIFVLARTLLGLEPRR